MKIEMRKMGCNFMTRCAWREDKSDIGNYRVRVTGYVVPCKELGCNVFVEFGFANDLRFTNKRTGLPLKYPVHDRDYAARLSVDIAFENSKGCWRPLDLEKRIRSYNWQYTSKDILKVLNYIAGADLYDEIVWVD